MKSIFRMALLTVAATGLAVAPWALAQGGKNPLVSDGRAMHDTVKTYLVKSADQVPETLYGFKPTPEVRSFGQLFGHIADTNYTICSMVIGEKPPVQGIEKSKTSKADLTKALGDSFTYCDKAFAGLTDASAVNIIDFWGSPMAKLSALAYNTGHSNEHYGNIVTYLRINKMVPPSSQGM